MASPRTRETNHMTSGPDEQPPRKLLDRHGGRRPLQPRPAITDYRIKLLALGSFILLSALSASFCTVSAFLPYEDDPNDNFVPLFTETESRILAIIVGALFAIAVIWAVRRLRLHLRTKPERN